MLLAMQDGVIARRQLLAAGWGQTQVARKLRRREWVQVHPGVYVNHTGPPTWQQRAWAAVLACWPAALGGWSAVRAHEGPVLGRPCGTAAKLGRLFQLRGWDGEPTTCPECSSSETRDRRESRQTG